MNLPFTQATHASLQHATKFRLCAESLLSVPRSAVVDGIISYGGSTGTGLNLPKKVYGEYFERNHFFTAVPVSSRKKLSEIDVVHREKLLGLCKLTDDSWKDHLFSFTRVYNIFDDSPREYFFNSLSLNGVRADSPWLGFSDSCACASHPDREKALHCSLMEFLERQSLLGSWMMQSCNYSIDPQVLKTLTPYQSLSEKLLDNGDLYIFENSRNLPGYTVFMFYFSHSEKDIVQYSIGAKSALSLPEALTSALEELYQCYAFLYNMESTSSQLENKAGSGYHLAFQQFNNQQTRKKIPFLHLDLPQKKLPEILAMKTWTYAEILSGLSEISPDIFYYHQYEAGLNLHFTKIISPDFFAHMSLHNRLNVDCLYAKTLGITKENAYLERLPFP